MSQSFEYLPNSRDIVKTPPTLEGIINTTYDKIVDGPEGVVERRGLIETLISDLQILSPDHPLIGELNILLEEDSLTELKINKCCLAILRYTTEDSER